MNSISKYHYISVVRSDILAKKWMRNVYQFKESIGLVLNVSSKHNISENKRLVYSNLLLELVSGNKPCYTKLKKSIASFKVRKGYLVGNKKTLRRKLMYQFMDKLHVQILACSRDFRRVINSRHSSVNIGISNSYTVNDIEFERLSIKARPQLKGFNISLTFVDNLTLSSFRIP